MAMDQPSELPQATFGAYFPLKLPCRRYLRRTVPALSARPVLDHRLDHEATWQLRG